MTTVTRQCFEMQCGSNNIASLEFPHRDRFDISGSYLNSASFHPMSTLSASAVAGFTAYRSSGGKVAEIVAQKQRAVLQLFARLINCYVDELSFVPTTMVGERIIIAALGLIEQRGQIVTDSEHFERHLSYYKYLRSRGIEVTVLSVQGNGFELDQFENAIRPGLSLVVLSVVSSLSGVQHDLRQICKIAHSRGALVYAELNQAAGAIPIDVRTSEVDFCSCVSHKWLMGDFGIAMLYAKREWPASLPLAQFRYRQLKKLAFNLLPCEDWKFMPLASEQAIGVALGLTNSAIVSLQVSLQYLSDVGVENIAVYRLSLIDQLRQELTALGYEPLTPRAINSPIVCFEVRNSSALRPLLSDAQIAIKLHNDRIRVAPSVFNTKDDIDLLIEVLRMAT